MKSIVRIFRYLRYFPFEVAMNIVFNVLHILFNLGSYVMIVPFVELLFGTGETTLEEPTLAFSQQALAEWVFWHLNHWKESCGLWQCLIAVGAGYLACSLLSNLFRYVAMAFLSTVRNGLIERLRNDIYHRITVLPISFFTKSRRGDIISRMSNDLFDVEWSVVSTLQYLVKDPVNVIVFSATLLFVSWRLFVLFLMVLPIGIWLIAKIGRSLKRNSQRAQQQLGGLFATIEECLGGLKAIKQFGQEVSESHRFDQTNNEYATTMVKVAKRRELSSPLSEILGTLALVIILILGGWQVIGGHIMPSVFIFFVIVFARLVPPIQAIVKAFNSLQKGSAAATRLFEVIDADEVIEELPDAPMLPPPASGIVLQNVGFRYEDGAYALKNISLCIPSGKMVAIVGPSGAGKSTLVDLIPRFYDPTEGGISIDGIDISTVNIDSLRAHFGIVSQTVFLFNDSVANNIAFGKDCDGEQIRRAASLAGADEFISHLPQGYDTMVGDRGLSLSGGQRQRISIARALLRNPSVLILDEATSALDSESEQYVQQGILELRQGRTVIVIAHRLSTVRNADMIVVMESGHIVECGTHEELVEKGGMYKQLIDMQSFEK